MGEERRSAKKNPNGASTWEGCSVLLDINDGDRLVFARLSPAATVKIGDKKLSLKPLVGCPFGSLFQVRSGPKGPQLARVLPPSSSTATGTHDDTGKKDFQLRECDCSKDNRSLVDNNLAQSLSSEDIDALRREGVTGDGIIEALIANSSTFEKKTVFSQEKYKLRKQKKYAPKVLLRHPSARSITEAYFNKHPARIGFMRLDALSLLLSMSNVHAYSDVLVVDKVGGLVTGAIAERLGCSGHICNTYFGERPYPLDIVKIFNFNADTCCRIVQAPFSMLLNAQGCNVRDEHAESILHPGLVEDQENADAPLSSNAVPSDLGDFVQSSQDQTVMEEKPQNYLDGPIPDATEVRQDDEGGNCLPFQSMIKSGLPGRHALPETIKLWTERGFTSTGVGCRENCSRTTSTFVLFSSFCNIPPISSASCKLYAQITEHEDCC